MLEMKFQGQIRIEEEYRLHILEPKMGFDMGHR